MNKLPRDSRSVAHALWGVKLSPEIEARALEYSRGLDRASNGDVGYNFFYGTLSTQANKSEATCKRLIELLPTLGVKITQVDREAFRKATAPVIDEFAKGNIGDFVQVVVAEAQKLR